MNRMYFEKKERVVAGIGLPVLMVIIVSFHLFNSSIGVISLSNVAVLLMTFLIGYQCLLYNIVLPRKLFYLSGVLLFSFAYFGIFSLIVRQLYGGSPGTEDIRQAVSWMLIYISFLFGYVFSGMFFRRCFHLMIAFVYFALSFIIVYMVRLIGINSLSDSRVFVSAVAPTGINELGLALYWFLSISLIYFYNRNPRKYIDIRIIACFILSLVVGTVIGSRQYILAVFFLICYTIFITHRGIKLSKPVITTLIATTTIVFVLYYLGAIDIFYNLLLERIEKSGRQLESGYERFFIWSAILTAWEPLDFFGQGIGAARNLVGSRTDSFYLELLFDNGIFGFILFFLLIQYLYRSAKFSEQNCNISDNDIFTRRILMFGFLINIFWFGFFNEVVREHFVWIIVGALLRDSPQKYTTTTTWT